jgi:thiosulfate dehydrogenase
MRSKKTLALLTGVGAAVLLGLSVDSEQAWAHKEKHTPKQLKAFDEAFMEQVRTGDLLFHGDAATQKRLNVNLSRTGMACAMCHPFTSDTHLMVPKFVNR